MPIYVGPVLDYEQWGEDGTVEVSRRCPRCGSKRLTFGEMGEVSCNSCGAFPLFPEQLKRKRVPISLALQCEATKAAVDRSRVERDKWDRILAEAEAFNRLVDAIANS